MYPVTWLKTLLNFWSPAFTSEVLLLQLCTDMSSLLAAGEQTQAFVHATQAFYQQSYTSNPKEI